MIAANQYNLIITIVGRGYSEQVMKAAKLGGATGGTIVLARGAGMHEAEKILGFSTEAHGISIAVPVEDAMGLPVADMERELHAQELRKTGT